MRIVFFGTPTFAKTILEYLFEQNVDIVAVITRPDKPRGRSSKPMSSPVKEWTLEKQLSLYQPPKVSDPEFSSFLKTLNADFFIVAAYAEILKPEVLEIPRLGSINVHGSLLPKYRGAAPVQRSLMAGEKETGVTIMKMAPKMDAGDILALCKTDIPLEMTAGELMDLLAEIGKKALWEVMQKCEKGTIEAIVQDGTQATHAKKITTEDTEVHWDQPAETVHNQIRGVTPNPGAWVWVSIRGNKKRLHIKRTLPNLDLSGPPGAIVSKNGQELIVACASGSLMLLEVQLEGKKSLPIKEFLKGFSLENINFII